MVKRRAQKFIFTSCTFEKLHGSTVLSRDTQGTSPLSELWGGCSYLDLHSIYRPIFQQCRAPQKAPLFPKVYTAVHSPKKSSIFTNLNYFTGFFWIK